jgi:hypothetical protein
VGMFGRDGRDSYTYIVLKYGKSLGKQMDDIHHDYLIENITMIPLRFALRAISPEVFQTPAFSSLTPISLLYIGSDESALRRNFHGRYWG